MRLLSAWRPCAPAGQSHHARGAAIAAGEGGRRGCWGRAAGVGARKCRLFVKFRRTHGKTSTTERHVIMAPRVIGQAAPTTLDTTRCGPVGQANATLPPFGGLPVEPSDGRSEAGSSDPVQPVLRGVDHFHCVSLSGLIGEKGQRYRRRSREFLSALRCHLPREERAKVCGACATMVGTCL